MIVPTQSVGMISAQGRVVFTDFARVPFQHLLTQRHNLLDPFHPDPPRHHLQIRRCFFASGIVSGVGAFLTELFPTRIRGSGQGFCYNIGRALAALSLPQTRGKQLDAQ